MHSINSANGFIGYNIFVAPVFERPEVEGKSLGEKIMYVIDGYNEGFDELFFEIVPNVLKDELIVPIYNDTKEMGRDLMNIEQNNTNNELQNEK